MLELRKEVNQLTVSGTAFERQKARDTASVLLRLIDVQLLRAGQRVFTFEGEPVAPEGRKNAGLAPLESEESSAYAGEEPMGNSALREKGPFAKVQNRPFGAKNHSAWQANSSCGQNADNDLTENGPLQPSDSSQAPTAHIAGWLKAEITTPNVVLSQPSNAILQLSQAQNAHISGASGCVVSIECSGPVLVRNAVDCVFSGRCHQLRVHGCQNCVFAVTTAGNRVVIEESNDVTIGPFEPGAPPPEVDDFSWPSGAVNPHFKRPPGLSGSAIGARIAATPAGAVSPPVLARLLSELSPDKGF